MSIIVRNMKAKEMGMERWVNATLLQFGGKIKEEGVVLVILQDSKRPHELRRQFSSASLG